MKISDKTIGCLSFISLFVLLGGITLGMWFAHRTTTTTTTVDFEDLGSLQTEDPVTDRGYQIGRVGTVTWLGDRARVVLIFNEPLVLREGTIFRNVNFAMMGQRRVDMIRSKTGRTVSDDYVFQGEFVPGVAEALRLMESTTAEIRRLRDFVMLIAKGDGTTPSLPTLFNSSLSTADSLIRQLERMTAQAEPQIRSLLSQTETASYTVISATHAADSTLHAIQTKADQTIQDANAALDTLSQGIASIDSITQKIEADSTARNLLNTRDGINRVDSLIGSLNALIKAINTKGIAVYDENGNKVKLITWKNLNIIGKTAREKARERQQQEK